MTEQEAKALVDDINGLHPDLLVVGCYPYRGHWYVVAQYVDQRYPETEVIIHPVRYHDYDE